MWAMVSRVKGSHILHWAPDYCLDLCVAMQCTGSILRGGKQLYTQHLYRMSVRWSLAFVNILSTSFFWSSHQTLLTRMLICSKRPHGLSREWASETDWEGETKRDRLTRWCHKTTFFFCQRKRFRSFCHWEKTPLVPCEKYMQVRGVYLSVIMGAECY